jgi:hypothetical protein
MSESNSERFESLSAFLGYAIARLIFAAVDIELGAQHV